MITSFIKGYRNVLHVLHVLHVFLFCGLFLLLGLIIFFHVYQKIDLQHHRAFPSYSLNSDNIDTLSQQLKRYNWHWHQLKPVVKSEPLPTPVITPSIQIEVIGIIAINDNSAIENKGTNNYVSAQEDDAKLNDWQKSASLQKSSVLLRVNGGPAEVFRVGDEIIGQHKLSMIAEQGIKVTFNHNESWYKLTEDDICQVADQTDSQQGINQSADLGTAMGHCLQ